MILDFKPIVPEMKDMAEAYIKPWEIRGSEYVFNNLLIWGNDECIRIAESGGSLFILLKYQNGSPFMFAPVTTDPENYGAAVKTAEEYFYGIGEKPLFKAISGPLKEAFLAHCPEYALSEDRNNYDYIYLAQDLITLAGKHYHSKRNHINNFSQLHNYEYTDINSSMLNECIRVYEDWLKGQDVDLDGVLGEREAITMLISNMEKLNVKGGGIKIDGVLKAFTMGEKISGDTALIHIEKADKDITGLYTVINQQFAEHCFSDCVYINREEDMGIEGLRRAKLSYRPIELLEKYTAEKRS